MPDMLRIARLPLPDDWSPEGVICALVPIPDDPEFLAHLIGIVDALRFSATFGRDATRTGAATVARTWRDALNTAPIMTLDECGGATLFDVRQKPGEPCILEKSTDGGETWVAWADLTLCPPVVGLASDGKTIIYWCPTCGPDGGPGWSPVPNPDEGYNPAFDDPQIPVPDDWVEPGETPCCVFAANLTEALKSIFERVDFGLFTGSLATVVWAAANGVYAIVNRFMAKKITEVLTAIATLSSFSYSEWHDDYEDFDWQYMTDQLCCFFDEDGTVSQADFTNAMALLSAETGPVWTATKMIFDLVGPNGINNAATYGGITAADCTPDCDPDLNLCWTFSDDDFDFVPVSGKGVWSEALNWRAQQQGDLSWQLDITCTTDIPSGIIDEIRVDWVPTGGAKLMQCYVNGVLKREVAGGNAGFRTTTFAVGEAVTSVRIYLSQNNLNSTLYARRICFYRT